MPSTFSTNYGIELISTGEQAGLWGDTTNRNYQRFEQMAGGVATVTIDSPEGDLTSVWTPPTFKWITTDTAEAGELNSEGRCKFVSFTSIGDLGSDINVEVYGNSTADNPTRAFIVKNELLASRSITFKCGGSPSSTLAVPNGKSAYIYAKGNDIVNALGDVQVNTIDATTIESEVLDFSGAASSGDAQIKMPVGVSQALRFMDGATTMLNFDTSANKVISEVPFSCSSQIEGASGLFISAGDSTTQDLTVEGDLVVEGGFAGNFQIRDIQFVNDPDGTGIVGDGNEGVLGNPMDMVEHTFNFSTRIVVSRVLIIASCDIEADPNDDNQTFGSGPNQGTNVIVSVWRSYDTAELTEITSTQQQPSRLLAIIPPDRDLKLSTFVMSWVDDVPAGVTAARFVFRASSPGTAVSKLAGEWSVPGMILFDFGPTNE